MSYYAYYKEFGDVNVCEFATEAERDEWVADEETVLTRVPMTDERVIDMILNGDQDDPYPYMSVVDEFNPRQIVHIRSYCFFVYPD